MGTNTTSGKNLLIALPIYRSIEVGTFQSVIKFMVDFQSKARDWEVGFDFHAGECPIGRCRNDLAHKFLENREFTHILYIDSDIVFSFDQVEKLLSHDEDIVGGYYFKKCEGQAQPVCNRLSTVDEPNERGLVKMKYMGTGFLRISRKVFEVMAQEMPELEYVCDSDNKTLKHDFWRMGVVAGPDGKKRWLSEDWQFCQFALDLGFDVWADAQCILRHTGIVAFPLSYQISQLYSRDALQRMGLLESQSKFEPWRLKEVAEYDIDLDFTPASILDIGANIGCFSDRCHTKWPNAYITAYEPLPENAKRYEQNCPYASLTTAAVRTVGGKDKLMVGDMDVTGGFHDTGRQTGELIEVYCIPASTLPSCQLVKIDTEGCEVEILKDLNLSQTLALVCEYHKASDVLEIRNICQAAGLLEMEHNPNPKDSNFGILKFSSKKLLAAPSGAPNNAGAGFSPESAPAPLETAVSS